MIKLTAKQSELIERLGYRDALDFLTHYPFRYERFVEKPQSLWQSKELVIFEGQLASGFSQFRFGGRVRTSFKVLVDEEIVSVNIFNRPYLKASLFQERIVVIGTVADNGSINARSVNAQPLIPQLGIHPVYPTKTGIKQHDIVRVIKKILNELEINDIIPAVFKERYQLLSRRQALRACHMPQSDLELKAALRTLKYEEFLIYHTVNALNAQTKKMGSDKVYDPTLIEEIITNLPFALAEDQIQSLQEILDDIHSSKKMNRLLQGDVGSGKTIVAHLAAIAVLNAGYQVAFMVPTEILVKQQYESMLRLMPSLKAAMLTQSTQTNDLYEGLKDGSIQYVVGTHALFQESVKFSNLGLVIIDEQHRFGVEQRRTLIEKGDTTDVLMLSATPIPRTLAASLYFDLDISTIKTYPKNRLRNKTILVEENSLRTILPEVNDALQHGTQVYVVCPAIAESEAKGKGIRNVNAIYKQLVTVFPEYRVSSLHGKTPSDQKEAIMSAFAQGEIDILISTTVIEVGIDVPNANRMIIYNAEMFGLATLHQLRGRIGRCHEQGICYLLSSADNEDSLERLHAIVGSEDGFDLSMKDLRMRGMGDVLGGRQSGLPHFILGDIQTDEAILMQAKKDAAVIVNNLNETSFSTVLHLAEQVKMMYN